MTCTQASGTNHQAQWSPHPLPHKYTTLPVSVFFSIRSQSPFLKQAKERMCTHYYHHHHHHASIAIICIFLLQISITVGHHKPTSDEIVRLLQLQPAVPEGGYFAETFRDPDIFLNTSCLPPHYKVGRSVSTAIYYFLPSGNVSHLHRLPSSEVWHFYSGEPLSVFEIDDDGHTTHTVLGPDFPAGQKLQHVQRPWVWFGAYLTKDIAHIGKSTVKTSPRDPQKHYALVGTTVAPAFQPEDFELASRKELVAKFPHAQAIIEFLTYP